MYDIFVYDIRWHIHKFTKSFLHSKKTRDEMFFVSFTTSERSKNN